MLFTIRNADGTTTLTVRCDDRWSQLSDTELLGPWPEYPEPTPGMPAFLCYNPDDDPPPIFDVRDILWGTAYDDEEWDPEDDPAEEWASIGLEIMLVKTTPALDCLPDVIEF
jgi:hypothetical protein